MKKNLRTRTRAAICTLVLAAATTTAWSTTLSAKMELAKVASRTTASVESDNNPSSLINNNAYRPSTPFWSGFTGTENYGKTEYVELQWDANCQIIECRVYWAQQGEDIEYPTEAYLSRWNGREWVRADVLQPADALQDGLSKTTDIDVTTNRLRIYMTGRKACGIHEVRLFGYRTEGCEKATLTDELTSIPFINNEPVTLAPVLSLPDGEEEEPLWTWTLPDGTQTHEAEHEATEPGQYKVEYQRLCGSVTEMTYNVFDPSESYTWPEYSPTLNYDFRIDHPSFPAPTKMLPENNNAEGIMADGWWAVAWGPNTNPYVTETAKKELLKKMNEDFAFFRDEMGWPPDKRARNGYYSTVYVYGSGLYSDNASNTELGGWQSATWYDNQSWPMVSLSYYPIACFDPDFTYDKYHNAVVNDQIGQQNACVHEGIHAILADLAGCKQAHWFQEAGNTWLQAEAELMKSGKTPASMGFLSAGNMIAPFLPIECYSGWLLDDSFGGPGAEGVNMYDSNGQVCTWRNLLGGVQYGELFPHIVTEILGRGAIPWIWANCPGRVLEGMAKELGDKQMRRLILEYRVRQALIDVGMWSTACRKLLDDNWLVSIKQEWAPYSQAVKEWKATPYSNMYPDEELGEGWYYPEYRTTPGWSGANQIPLHVSGNEGDIISMHFKPLGENMVCQLAYRAEKTGALCYSQPVEGEGDVVMQLKKKPANGVVIAIVCNTDYIYKGEETRKAHFDYRLKMGQNMYQPAKAQLKWYNYRSIIKDNTFTAIEEVKSDVEETKFDIITDKTVVNAGEQIQVTIKAAGALQIPVVLSDMSGRKICSKSFLRDGEMEIPSGTASGVYIVTAYNGHSVASRKIVVR